MDPFTRFILKLARLFGLASVTLLTSVLVGWGGGPEPSAPPDFPTPTQEMICFADVLPVSLNVRSGPGIDYPSIGGLAAGDVVEVLEIARVSGDRWYRIKRGALSGWSAGFFRGNVYLSIPGDAICTGLPERTLQTAADSHAIP